ncbi:MAG: hypothetical protein ACYSW6_07155 [Planctomycetota bacterium]|jgi:hypothetical protein
MNRRKLLKFIHFAGTAWLMISAGYILILAMRQAGQSWWLIISISGYSVFLGLFLISLYLFAIFRGFARSRKKEVEHPLTATFAYSVFYDSSPFLGVIAAAVCTFRDSRDCLLMIAFGSLWTTFLVWIVIDPILGLAEMQLPSSREHRRKRLAEARALKQTEQAERKKLSTELETNAKRERQQWRQQLLPYAERLAFLAAGINNLDSRSEKQAIEIGVAVWQMGGLNCMRQLHSMAMEIYKRKYTSPMAVDYVSIWWDGVGSWRCEWLEEVLSSA